MVLIYVCRCRTYARSSQPLLVSFPRSVSQTSICLCLRFHSRYAPEKIPYGIKRYQDETARLYSVLESQLAKSDSQGYLVGGKFSVADINVFPWVRSYSWAGVDITPFPNVAKWLERIEARPATYKGLGVPERRKGKRSKEEEEEDAREASKWVMDGQKK